MTKDVLPKISIVTPVYNGVKYIQESIESILNQNYPNLEYIIIDGGSTDGTLEKIDKYKNKISIIVSEQDNGIYDALNKGFNLSTGEIMTWLNADDLLHKNSLFVAAELLSIQGVNWITGFPNEIDEFGRSVKVGDNGNWSKLRLQTEDTCIQQEGTFWRRSLWEKSGEYISTKYSLAGDFELWNRFFDFENIYRVNCLMGSFRISRFGQLSSDVVGYFQQVNQIRENNLLNLEFQKKMEAFHWIKKLDRKSKHIFSKYFNAQIVKLHNFPPIITFSRESQSFYIIK